jgi:GAF domain-containing protein
LADRGEEERPAWAGGKSKTELNMASDNLTPRGTSLSRQGPQVQVQWAGATQFAVPIPPDEKERLADLRSYRILDTPPEEDLDNLTQLAAHVCGTPMALISLVDAGRQWFKSKVGVDIAGTPREQALCAHAIMQPDLFVVADTAKDERFARNPLVTAAPKIRFYAGAPLVSPDHHVLGTLCVIDRVPRQLTQQQIEALRALSRQVMAHLVMRRQILELRAAALEHQFAEKQLQKGRQTAEASSRIKHDLLQKLGLQVRANLTEVRQITEQVLASDLTPKQRRFLETVRKRAAELLALAEEILELAKVTLRKK